jgi:hypothetical protein
LQFQYDPETKQSMDWRTESPERPKIFSKIEDQNDVELILINSM